MVPVPSSADGIVGALNPAQREAVEHEGAPLLVLAGAGSGKTRVLTHRVAYHIRVRGYDPGEILAVTFTRKAAQEMSERVQTLLPEVAPRWWIGTFHALGARILRPLAERFSRTGNFVVYDQDDTLRLLKRLVEESRLPWGLTAAETAEAIAKAKAELQSPELREERAAGPREEALATIYRRYEEATAAMDAFDFGDLLAQPVRLFQDDPTELARHAARFREVLVDEYQDTNRVQVLLVRLLSSYHRRIMVVGDDDQSIYAWRGADVANILQFERDFPQARVIRLEENYRSTAMILEAAQGLIAHNQGRHPKALWTRGARGTPIIMMAAADETAEARMVVGEVQRLLEQEGREPGEVAVLYRTNAQSRALEEAFRRGMLRTVLVGTLRFYDRREVKDLISYLRLLVNPRDEVSLLRVINLPSRGIGPRTVEQLTRWATEQGSPLGESLERVRDVPELGPAARERVERFARQLAGWRARVAQDPPQMLARRVVEESGYWDHLGAEGGRESEERRDNVRELLSSLEAYAEEHPGADLNSFLEEMALSADIDRWDTSRGAVTLMTLHNAKGLEFPLVFITGLEEGLLPHRSAVAEGGRELEEERRLFYVGLTRARERVWLAAAARRRGAAGGETRLLSRFVGEMPSGCVEFIEGAAEEVGRDARFGWGSRRSATPGDPWELEEGAIRGRGASGSVDPEDAADEGFDDGHWIDPRCISPGQWVRHPQWGKGRVVSREGDGRSLALTILFDGRVRKKVLARYAHLELL